MCGMIQRRETKTLRSTQLKFYKIVTVSMMTHDGENWTVINRLDKRKIESAEMKFIAGYSLLHQKRSTDKRSELNKFNLSGRIEERKENCHEHILRMATDRHNKSITKL